MEKHRGETRRSAAKNNEGFIARTSSFFYINLFFLCICTAVIIISAYCYRATPIRSEKTNLLITCALFCSLTLSVLIELFIKSSGYILKIDAKGITIMTGSIFRIFKIRKWYVSIPWENIYAVFSLNIKQPIGTTQFIMPVTNTYLYIIPCKDASKSFKKKYCISFQLFPDEIQIDLEHEIEKYKPEYFKHISDEEPYIFKFENERKDSNLEKKLNSLKRQTYFFNNPVIWMIIIVIFIASRHALINYLERNNTYFYQKSNPVYAVKFEKPEGWKRQQDQNRSDTTAGNYYIESAIYDDILGRKSSSVSICSGYDYRSPIDGQLIETVKNLKLNEWGQREYKSDDKSKPVDIYRYKVIGESKKYLSKNITIKRNDYLKLFNSKTIDEDNSEDSRKYLQLITYIYVTCDSSEFYISVETGSGKLNFTELVEDSKDYQKLLKWHNDITSEFLDSIVVKKGSEF